MAPGLETLLLASKLGVTQLRLARLTAPGALNQLTARLLQQPGVL
jgi:hypothetical protein